MIYVYTELILRLNFLNSPNHHELVEVSSAPPWALLLLFFIAKLTRVKINEVQKKRINLYEAVYDNLSDKNFSFYYVSFTMRSSYFVLSHYCISYDRNVAQ